MLYNICQVDWHLTGCNSNTDASSQKPTSNEHIPTTTTVLNGNADEPSEPDRMPVALPVRDGADDDGTHVRIL